MTVTVTRTRYGALVSAIGAIVLLVAVFLPWYGISFTARGVALAEQTGDRIVAQFGNAALQSEMAGVHTRLSGLVGEEFASLSAHQLLHTVSVVLLILGALGCVISLLALSNPEALGSGGRWALALIGLIAGALIAFRMTQRPALESGVLSLSLRDGAWLALIGSAAVVAGAVLPARARGARAGAAPAVWAELSGWTPER